jgi:hypothetical protein
MDQPVKPFTSEGGETRRWIGRLIIAVLLGEAIWGLIVSFMNHVFVPWLGDVMGQSSGLPTSFTQRPYNYPELFVSVFEFCIAGLVAAILNYFFQRPIARRVKAVKSSVPAAPLGPIRVVPQAPAAPVLVTETAPPQFGIAPAPSPMPSPVQEARAYPVIPSILIPAESAPPGPPPGPAPAPEAKLVAPTPPPPIPSPVEAKPVAAKPVPPPPKVEPAKPKKPKNVYYNIVGEPMPSDDD